MNRAFLLFALLSSFHAFADTGQVYCFARIHSHLAIAVRGNQNDFLVGRSFRAEFNFDDLNFCHKDEETGQEMCTEIAAPSYEATFINTTRKKTQDSVSYRIERLASLDVGLPAPTREAKKFARKVKFHSVATPDANLSFVYLGKDYVMNCITSGL